MKRLSFEPLAPKVRAAYHRTQADIHAAAGYPALAQWHHECAEWLDPTPRVRARPDDGRRQERVEHANAGYLRVNHRRAS